MSQIANLSIEELRQLQNEAEELIALKKEQAILDAYNTIIQAAEKVGLSIDAVLQYGQDQKKKTRKKVEPRYRSKINPDNTWTGRGKRPSWLVLEIEKGANIDDLLIK
ncbi:TPA: H-NS histone family protein [Acinetobacter baumannii]|nr:H-NS histone family protein [Acinetobacter baumannii]